MYHMLPTKMFFVVFFSSFPRVSFLYFTVMSVHSYIKLDMLIYLLFNSISESSYIHFLLFFWLNSVMCILSSSIFHILFLFIYLMCSNFSKTSSLTSFISVVFSQIGRPPDIVVHKYVTLYLYGT